MGFQHGFAVHRTGPILLGTRRTDTLLGVDLLLKPKTYFYLGIIAGLILVFNGYLTARPVVLYGETYQIG